jgi:uncharacterized protein
LYSWTLTWASPDRAGIDTSNIAGSRQHLNTTGLIRLCVGILILGGASKAIAAPSAECAVARGSVARTICRDQKLSRLNMEMRGLYRKALLVGDRRSLIAEQWTWIVDRNRNCEKKQRLEIGSCVAQSLNARIVELRSVLESNPSPSEKLAAASPPMLPAATPKQNVDCTNASGTVDRAICTDTMLSHWEDRLGKLYQQALDDPPVRSVLSDDQQRWIGERNGTCGELSSTKKADCVLQMTKRRIEQLVQLITSRDEPEDRSSKVVEILSGKTSPPWGLDADTIDRESARAEQSELIIGDAKACIRKNAGVAGGVTTSDSNQVVALMSALCFDDFSKRLSALELGALAKPSFEMLVHQELSASK